MTSQRQSVIVGAMSTEDLDDIAAIEDRKDDPTISFEQAVAELGFTMDEICAQAKMLD